MREVAQPAEILELHPWHVRVPPRGLRHAIPAVHGVAEAEFEIDAARAGGVGGAFGGVVLAQVPVLVVDIDLDVEGVLGLVAGAAAPLGVEDYLCVGGARDGQVAHVGDGAGELAGGGVVGEADADHGLHGGGELVEERRASEEFGGFDGAAGEDDGLGEEGARLGGEGVGGVDAVLQGAVGDMVDAFGEFVEQQEETPVVAVGDAGGEADLVDEELGGVEDAGGFGEEGVPGGAGCLEVWLVHGAGGLADGEVGGEGAVLESLDDLVGDGSHGM